MVGYLATVALFLLPFAIPGARLWGVGVWLYLPLAFQIGFIAVGLGTPLILLKLGVFGQTKEPSDGISRLGKFWVVLGSVTVVLGGVYYLLRARTHFLGDGYSQLDRLTSQNPFIKPWDFGEELVHVLFHRLLEGQVPNPSLAAYQWAAVLAGLLFVILGGLGARYLFDANRDRITFTLGVAAIGCSLMFFGYVENYAYLSVSIISFTVGGLVVARRGMSRWLVVPPLLVAIFMHSLGVLLLPAAVFLLIGRDLPVSRLQRLRIELRILLLVALVLGSVLLAHIGYRNVLFLRMVMLPVVADTFTLRGYTLFSWSHLVDFLNLILILLPGVFLFAVSGTLSAFGRRVRWPEYQFLLMLVLPMLGAAFLIEPGLGMPRDWDALSFPAVPLGVLCFYTALDRTRDRQVFRTTAILAMVLGFLSILPRAITQTIPQQGVDLAMSHFKLDIKRNRSGMWLLGQYYLEKGDSASYRDIQRVRTRWYPEEAMIRQARQLLERRDIRRAVEMSRRVIQLNPKNPAGWMQLGRAFLFAGRYDSALTYLQVSNALNPGSYRILISLGRAHYAGGDFDHARELWTQAASIDSTAYAADAWLGRLSADEADITSARSYLSRAASRTGAPGWVHMHLADALLATGDAPAAIAAYAAALEKGADPKAVAQATRRYPQVQRSLGLDTLDLAP